MTSRNGRHRRSDRDLGVDLEIDLRSPRLSQYDGRYGDPTPAADSASEASIELAALRSTSANELAVEASARRYAGNASSGL
ncbi:hypothetical protein [Fodinicola acaciae]|uniref:hypothetical protein n=1 Tax=Fodinicola acaciae TaxID=2681555 RepID=UPI0013D8D4AF|nr:hypothetical protein [Fodinicola acaciae]